MDKSIFISYCWSNEKEADEIDLFFKLKGIELKRDKRELKYTKSIKEFMKKIRETDYVLMIISDEYLKSFNCMYEVLEFIKDDDYKDRILPVIIDNAKIYGITAGVEYIKYWNEELLKLNSETEGLPQEDIIHILENKKRLKKIQASIIEFISEVSDMKHYSYKEVKEANYSQIFDYIGINEGAFQPKIVINDENLMSESYSEKYKMDKTSGTVTFDYSNNNGIYTVGQNELLFDLKWSKASNTSIHFYNDPQSIKEVALVKDVSDITEIADAQVYDVSSRARTVNLNQIAIFRNTNGFYCAVKILDLKDDTSGDTVDEITFEYVIQTNGTPYFKNSIDKNEIQSSNVVVNNPLTRERDVKLIKEILLCFPLNIFDNFFLNIPKRFFYEITPYFDSFEGILQSSHYYLYDKTIKSSVENIYKLQQEFVSYESYYEMIDSQRIVKKNDCPSHISDEIQLICIEMNKEYKEFLRIIREEWIEIDLTDIQREIGEEIRREEANRENKITTKTISVNPYGEIIQNLDNLLESIKQQSDNYFSDLIYYPDLVKMIAEWRKEIVNIENCLQRTGVTDYEKHQKIGIVIFSIVLICNSLEKSNWGKNKDFIDNEIEECREKFNHIK